ncbi:TPA: sulfate permease [Burkholderia multivorans]|uniref:SulP family inorganic anion transporter n=1 Tax=Burkholderia multivorans TaxID=87883 RepID=UPI00158E26A8|nr:sulfate permease [Burkholderia multivorans]MBU9318575.1 sulfate permease [Burkholderia multivorans]MDN7941981.1 sulfate permease [Burkholderia multivorans]HEF4742763.1 sulfate permease [Burkholderia multivorans]
MAKVGVVRLGREVARYVPGFAWIGTYRIAWLPGDAIAGATLSAVLVPAGMAYAIASGLSAASGLYASIAALVAYAVFGPSRVLVLGPDSALIALIAASVVPLAHGNAAHAAALAGALALLSGALCLAVGLFRLGFITDLLSMPIRYGYLNGIVVTIIVSQLPKLLGLTVHEAAIPQQLHELATAVAAGKTNLAALSIGVLSLAVILAFKRWMPRMPGVLVAVVVATVAAAYFDLAARAGIGVVGTLPRGLPMPEFPALAWNEWLALPASAAAIALVSLTDLSMLSQIYGLRNGERVNRNREFVALGIANIAAGLFQGFAVAASGSRTPVAEGAGAKSQACGLIAALIVAALLLFVPQALRDTPQATLGAVVVAASLSLIEITGLRRLYRLRRPEFVQSLACFAGVVVWGVVAGVGIALGLAVLAFLWRAWRPYSAVLGRRDGVKGYHDIARHPDARRIPGLVLLRWDAPLFFANAEIFHERVLTAAREAPTHTRWVAIAAEPVTDIDVTAADMLARLDGELHDADVQLCFAELKGPVKDSLKRYGLYERIGEDHFMPTLGETVSAYLKSHSVEWRDWEGER